MTTKAKPKKTRYCQLPSPGSIAGRSSSITNAFFNSIIPIHEPSEEEVFESLTILGIDKEDIRCAYCGDQSTEWDHMRPIITDQKPTGYITEIANLVPSCGKCNQSKGKQHWRTWMLSSARLSPTTRKIADIDARIEKLALYAMWKPPTKIDFSSVISAAVWEQYHTNLRSVLDLLKHSQKLARQIRETTESAPRHRDPATGQVIYGQTSRNSSRETEDRGELIPHEEVFARLNESMGWED